MELCRKHSSEPVQQTATHVSAHGWRYSEVTEPPRHHLVCDDSESLYLGVKRTLRARVDAAWRSGSEIAADILARQGTYAVGGHPF